MLHSLLRLVALVLVLATPATVLAQAKADKPATPSRSPLGGLGGSGKEPIKIDADRLDVFDKEQRAVFAGNVVAVQGDTTMRCTTLTVFYDQAATKSGTSASTGSASATATASASAGTGNPQDNGIKKLDCKGPVTVVSKDQTATGDNATYDKVANKVILTGNAVLSQGPNVTRGERVVYDLNTSIAKVEGGRVQSVLVPGSTEQGDKPGKPKKADGKAAPGTN
jgi:lipopolysaccharide export system protein LptA